MIEIFLYSYFWLWIIFLLIFCIFNIKYEIKKSINKPYKSVNEMLESLKRNETLWDKFILNPKMNWLRYIIYNFFDIPKDIYNNIKWFIQRGQRGYAECDVWEFDVYLSETITNGLKDLKSQLHGFPCNFISKDEWKSVLDEIIWTFEVAQKIINSEWVYLKSKERNKKSINIFAKEYNYHIMTKEECERYRKGWDLFKKHYFSLWD